MYYIFDLIYQNKYFLYLIYFYNIFNGATSFNQALDKWNISELACDYIFLGNNDINFDVPGTLGLIYNYKKWIKNKKGYPFLTPDEYLRNNNFSKKMNIIYSCLSDLSNKLMSKLNRDKSAVLLIDTYNKHGMAEQRKLFIELINNQIKYDCEIIDKGTVAPKFDKTLDDIIRNISLKSC